MEPMMIVLEDATVVARVLAGDRGTFRCLVDLYAGRVHRLCYGLLRHEQDAEDAAQETFLRAYRALGRFDPRRSFPKWLLTIATNECRDRLRRRRSGLRLVGLEARAEPADPAAGPPPRAGSTGPAALLGAVAAAIDRLPPDYREVFCLYHRDGRSYAEMAEILGRPLGTIKIQLHRARRRVCDLVGEADRPPGPVVSTCQEGSREP